MEQAGTGMIPTLVIGNGLVGSALSRWLRAPRPVEGIPWEAPIQARAALYAAVRDHVASGKFWQIAWCAGPGSIGSNANDLMQETEYLHVVLSAMGHARFPGKFMLTSSAGGIHGAGADVPIDEMTQPSPVSPYGFNKLIQENVTDAWALRSDNDLLIVRPSNVYGPGQNVDKPQGLITQVLWKILHNEIIELSVPRDTRRDFIYADDAGRSMAALLEAHHTGIRLVCAGESVTLQTVFDLAAAITGEAPKIREVTRNAAQPHRLEFLSSYVAPFQPTALSYGMQQTWQHLKGRAR